MQKKLLFVNNRKLKCLQSAKDNAHKKQKNCEIFIYTKIQTLIKNQDNLRYVFIYKNPDTIRYTIFHETSEIGTSIQKALQLTFLYTKIQTLFKKKDNLSYVFTYKNPDTLRERLFIEFFKFSEGRDILIF